ncbi:3-(3-hydroxy-phenyl)propionate hydroxylase [Rhodococcus sp. SMB37]|uniref:bifunctional 3-(3-hydroxy-phenyl)propionate/3-hydroxycinnamic acid hydroxylase MhpA n=1 Tax=Rhodococcus sp. SMB37 TaxID=2512213 RepID=UPI00104D0FA7|nr:bifunctional 3-(3-hydroxy-phenyl)propionate/3-hydroxycinnamic acid hydroxylase [Rhodococcus sp. SMB37]TCN50807.1 3-(3-hydroxy-phenyl)propionate hydroxylase [Rhodococcus sp. SMB37]
MTDGRERSASEPAAVDVLIVGAGPVGLTLANILGARGLQVLIAEERDVLIDYPRGVGLDDESMRAFQGIGLARNVEQHLIPNQILRFVNGNGELLAEMAPSRAQFGWPRRNGFVQPLVDAELLEGLARFDTVDVCWSTPMQSLREDGDGVVVELRDRGAPREVRARYVVGCDGGKSRTRHIIGTAFDGVTSSTRWLVVDLAHDPLGSPNSYVGADPERPYASISIAHGIRRFEFMLMDDEHDSEVDDIGFVRALLGLHIPRPEDAEIIAYRIYTHHSRIAGEFGRGRIFIAGDAAHLMPVWQGQGYNSGMRDAVNLGWKLAAVCSGQADPDLLTTYDAERRGHARAMIDLSTMVGRVISVRDKRLAWLRDRVLRSASALPALKRYILEMRFKPMPRYETGAVVPLPGKDSPVGRMFIQPEVVTENGRCRLDEALGSWFAVLCWNNDPTAVLDKPSVEAWRKIGARLVTVVPAAQVGRTSYGDDVTVVGDPGQLKAWFDAHRESVLFLRPDRFVAAAGIAQDASLLSTQLLSALRMEKYVADSPSGATAG